MSYKKFEPIYYLTLYAPTFEKTFEMVGKYVSHGGSAVQIDIPASNPVYETEFVKNSMLKALENNSDYSLFLDNIVSIRKRFPLLSIHLVVYPEVITATGFERFVSFTKEINASSVMIAGGNKDVLSALASSGVPIIRRIERTLDDEELKNFAALSEEARFNFNYKRHAEISPHGLDTFKKKISYIRESGVRGLIYAVEGVSDYEKMKEVYDSGANGVLIGNALMNKWNNEEELWALFDMFQSFSD